MKKWQKESTPQYLKQRLPWLIASPLASKAAACFQSSPWRCQSSRDAAPLSNQFALHPAVISMCDCCQENRTMPHWEEEPAWQCIIAMLLKQFSKTDAKFLQRRGDASSYFCLLHPHVVFFRKVVPWGFWMALDPHFPAFSWYLWAPRLWSPWVNS